MIVWEDAALGDPLSDVGNTRLELLWAQGEVAMQRFTRHYATETGHTLAGLPFWGLRAARRPCGRLHTWGLEAAAVLGTGCAPSTPISCGRRCHGPASEAWPPERWSNLCPRTTQIG